MADEENKLAALKNELENIKEDLKDGRISGVMLCSMALMSALLDKLPGEDTWTGLDHPGFKIPFPSMSPIASAACRDIYREIYGSEPDEEVGLEHKKDFRNAIKYCTDEGMLNLRFDGNYQLAPHTQWKSFKQRKEEAKRKEETKRKEEAQRKEEEERKKDAQKKRKRARKDGGDGRV